MPILMVALITPNVVGANVIVNVTFEFAFTVGGTSAVNVNDPLDLIPIDVVAAAPVITFELQDSFAHLSDFSGNAITVLHHNDVGAVGGECWSDNE